MSELGKRNIPITQQICINKNVNIKVNGNCNHADSRLTALSNKLPSNSTGSVVNGIVLATDLEEAIVCNGCGLYFEQMTKKWVNQLLLTHRKHSPISTYFADIAKERKLVDEIEVFTN